MLLNHFKYVRRIHTVSNQLPTGRAYAPCFRHHHHDDLQSMQSINLTLMEIYSNCQRAYSSTNEPKLKKNAMNAMQKSNWEQIISEAGKCVGYPTSYVGLHWLLNDEFVKDVIHLRKLVRSNHPLLKTTKNLVYREQYCMLDWGLIVLLVSKAAGLASNIHEIKHEKTFGVLHSQRVIAEVCEMIRISHLMHQDVVNLQSLTQAGQDVSLHGDIAFGNKIAILNGDYLLGNSKVKIFGLRYQYVSELISSAIRDLIEAEFIGDRDEQNNPLPSKPLKIHKQIASNVNHQYDLYFTDDVLRPMEKTPFMGNPETEWALRNILGAGNLLGKCCQCALKLADLPELMQKHGFEFGINFVLVWQACLDLEPFLQPTLKNDVTFSLVSAPVLYHLEYDANAYELIKRGYESVKNVDYKTLHSVIREGPGIKKTQQLQRKHSLAAINVLKEFPPSDAQTALQNILFGMQL